MLEDTRLKIFMAVADEGSFTRAAYLMGITQPAVSQHIAELERITGRPLFERGKGTVRLTPDGELLREHARRILSGYAALDTAFRSSDAILVSVAASPYLSRHFLPGFLEKISSRMPVRFRVSVIPEGRPAPDSDLSFYTDNASGNLDFQSVPVGECIPAAAAPGSSPLLDAATCSLAVWTPYHALLSPENANRVVFVSDDPDLAAEWAGTRSDTAVLLPADALPATFRLLSFPFSSFRLDVRCRQNEEFARTAPGELIRGMLPE